MKPQTLIAAVAVALLLAGAPVTADENAPAFERTGSFLVGNPVAYLAYDACGTDGLTSGVDSDCFALDADYSGRAFTLVGEDAHGTLALVSACFYDADGYWISCDGLVVPDDTAFVSVSAVGGVDVTYTFTIP